MKKNIVFALVLLVATGLSNSMFAAAAGEGFGAGAGGEPTYSLAGGDEVGHELAGLFEALQGFLSPGNQDSCFEHRFLEHACELLDRSCALMQDKRYHIPEGHPLRSTPFWVHVKAYFNKKTYSRRPLTHPDYVRLQPFYDLMGTALRRPSDFNCAETRRWIDADWKAYGAAIAYFRETGTPGVE